MEQKHTHHTKVLPDTLLSGEHLDPVCGMTVFKEKANGHSVYNGADFYFCNPKCESKFDETPEQYWSISMAFFLMVSAQANRRPELELCEHLWQSVFTLTTKDFKRIVSLLAANCLQAVLRHLHVEVENIFRVLKEFLLRERIFGPVVFDYPI